MKLYYTPGACSLAGHVVAVEGKLPLELVRVNLKTHTTEDGADYRAINPKGYVPALQLENGNVLTENGAILPFLGDRAGMMPEGEARYHALEWIAYLNSEVHKSFAPLFAGAPEADQAKAREKIRGRLQYAEDRLTKDYLLGDISPADAYLYVMLRWCEKHRVEVSGMPRLADFRKRMEARPGVQKALAAEGL